MQGDLGDAGVQLHHSQMRVEDGGMVGGSIGVGIRAGFQSIAVFWAKLLSSLLLSFLI